MNKMECSDIELMAIIEGLLFIYGEAGITYDGLVKHLPYNKNKNLILGIITKLVSKHESDPASGLSIIKVGTMYKLTTKQEHAAIYQNLKPVKNLRLSSAALEILAIIGYNQPVTKSQINTIRGVNCDATIYKLKQLNLITNFKNKTLSRRQNFYITTEQFMDYFQIESLEQLPKLPNFEAKQTGEIKIYNYDNNEKNRTTS